MKPNYEHIEQMERELLDGDHPYGTTPGGLITEVRVEQEKLLQEADLTFPPLVDRLAEAEIEARQRWPEHFIQEEQ